MKKKIAQSLALVSVLSVALASSPAKQFQPDVVSAATNSSTTTTTTPVKTTTPTKTSTKTAAPTVPGQTYVVVKGDKMWKIAKKFGLSLNELKALNPQIKNANLIRVGQKITVAKAVATTPAPAVPVATAKKLYHGFGEEANYRFKGTGNLNITTASVIFDQDGKIVDLNWDVMEITDKLFPGWADPKMDAAAQAAFKANIDDKFESKKEEGDSYGMKKAAVSGKEWWEQMSYYESFFKGKTVAQVEEWANKYTDANKRPFKLAYPDKLTDADKTATASFTDKEKAMLIDVTTSATMSLEDDHSHFLNALKEAYEARKEIK
jgi:LysM repeat protein